jgi:Mn2+/Fe2+ NRAMP family transporter
MVPLKQKLINLINVKTIVTFTVCTVFAILALRGEIRPEAVMQIVTTVIAFYFGTQHEKSSAGDNGKKE